MQIAINEFYNIGFLMKEFVKQIASNIKNILKQNQINCHKSKNLTMKQSKAFQSINKQIIQSQKI